MPDYKIRSPHTEELPRFARAIEAGFMEHSAPESLDDLVTDLGRWENLVALDGPEMVGSFGVIDFQTNVPGGQLQTGGVTIVTVAATHRRRGILTRMMRQMMESRRERGDAIASLLASETPIYGRYGYGMSVPRDQFKINRSDAVLAGGQESSGSVRLISLQEAASVAPAIFEAAGVDRPGWISRDKRGWEYRLKDPEYGRHDASALHCSLYEDDDGQTGYMLYRRTGDGRRDIRVAELIAASDRANAALWRYCFGIDLGEEITAPTRPIDDPLPWLLADMRKLDILRQDWIWTRILDVPAVLASRSYSSSGLLNLKLTDDFLGFANGTFALETDSDGASCSESSGTADLEMGIGDLAAIYFGGVKPSVLERAGRIEARSESALKTADAMFATRKAPWNVIGF